MFLSSDLDENSVIGLHHPTNLGASNPQRKKNEIFLCSSPTCLLFLDADICTHKPTKLRNTNFFSSRSPSDHSPPTISTRISQTQIQIKIKTELNAYLTVFFSPVATSVFARLSTFWNSDTLALIRECIYAFEHLMW